MDAIEKYEYEGLNISIYQDVSPENPREWDNIGKMLIVANDNYSSPLNETELTQEEIHELRCLDSKNDIEIALSKKFPKSVILPIYRYAHSGVVYNTVGYNDPWDSSHVGYIIATREDMLNEFDCKNITGKIRYRAENILRHEIKVYSQWANGKVYGFVLTGIDGEDINMIDASCWGLYDFNYCKQEAERTAKYVAPLWLGSAKSREVAKYNTEVEAAGQGKLF